MAWATELVEVKPHLAGDAGVDGDGENEGEEGEGGGDGGEDGGGDSEAGSAKVVRRILATWPNPVQMYFSLVLKTKNLSRK